MENAMNIENLWSGITTEVLNAAVVKVLTAVNAEPLRDKATRVERLSASSGFMRIVLERAVQRTNKPVEELEAEEIAPVATDITAGFLVGLAAASLKHVNIKEVN